jgi:hypothetical protein
MREGATVMSEPKAGARVWVRSNGSVERGTIAVVADDGGYLAGNDPGVTIVVDGGTSVVATTLASRGTIWDLDGEAAASGTT